MDYRPYVDRLFKQAPDRLSPTRENPITGSCWVRGIDRIGTQKKAACRALVARARFAWDNPGMPPLPLSYAEREELKRNGGVDYIVSLFARSLDAQKYGTAHRACAYAHGVMASPARFYQTGPSAAEVLPATPPGDSTWPIGARLLSR
jgi:hypothetical protein